MFVSIYFPLFKNKGSSLDRKWYRDTPLGEVSGKNASKYVRGCVLPLARSMCGQLQFGSGLNRGETAFALLYIRLVFDFCKAHIISVALVFLDIVTALAILLRRIIFEETGSDEIWLRRLRDTVFSDRGEHIGIF